MNDDKHNYQLIEYASLSFDVGNIDLETTVGVTVTSNMMS